MSDPFVLQVAQAVSAERQRQVSEEGWSANHDNDHADCELGKAGNCYLRHALGKLATECAPADWPWDAEWWKPKTAERDLVRAAALFVAERERLERLPPGQTRSRRLFQIELHFGDATRSLALIYKDRAEREPAGA